MGGWVKEEKDRLAECVHRREYVTFYVTYQKGCTFYVCVLSHVQHFANPWTVACKVPLSMGLSQ